MDKCFINIGFGSVIASNRVISIVNPDSAPIRRMIQHAKEENKLVDATFGRKTRAVIFMDNGNVVISGIQVDTIVNRFETSEKNKLDG